MKWHEWAHSSLRISVLALCVVYQARRARSPQMEASPFKTHSEQTIDIYSDEEDLVVYMNTLGTRSGPVTSKSIPTLPLLLQPPNQCFAYDLKTEARSTANTTAYIYSATNFLESLFNLYYDDASDQEGSESYKFGIVQYTGINVYVPQIEFKKISVAIVEYIASTNLKNYTWDSAIEKFKRVKSSIEYLVSSRRRQILGSGSAEAEKKLVIIHAMPISLKFRSLYLHCKERAGAHMNSIIALFGGEN